MSVDHSDVNGDYCYMNSSTVFVIRNHNSVDYINRRDEISNNRYLRGEMDYRMVYKLMLCYLHSHLIVPLLPSFRGLIVVFFLLQHHLTFLWQYFYIQPPESGKGIIGCLV